MSQWASGYPGKPSVGSGRERPGHGWDKPGKAAGLQKKPLVFGVRLTWLEVPRLTQIVLLWILGKSPTLSELQFCHLQSEATNSHLPGLAWDFKRIYTECLCVIERAVIIARNGVGIGLYLGMAEERKRVEGGNGNINHSSGLAACWPVWGSWQGAYPVPVRSPGAQGLGGWVESVWRGTGTEPYNPRRKCWERGVQGPGETLEAQSTCLLNWKEPEVEAGARFLKNAMSCNPGAFAGRFSLSQAPGISSQWRM